MISIFLYIYLQHAVDSAESRGRQGWTENSAPLPAAFNRFQKAAAACGRMCAREGCGVDSCVVSVSDMVPQPVDVMHITYISCLN